jgi:hypothetical protein
MMVDVPGLMLHKVPEAALLNVATDVLTLLHVPPAASVKVVQPPAHIFLIPPMAEGSPLTVTITVAVQPKPNE